MASPTQTMTAAHPRWDEFYQRLAGPEGCDMRDDGNGLRWKCDAGNNRPFAARILRAMGFDDASLLASLDHFSNRGGHCDCEILFNVDRRATR